MDTYTNAYTHLFGIIWKKTKFVVCVNWYPLFAISAFSAGVLGQNEFYQDVLVMIFFWAAASGAWNIIGGYGGLLSLGHSAFLGIGAYTSTLLFLHFSISPWLGMMAGGLLACLVASFLGVITIRLKGPYFALGTLAIGEVLNILAVYWKSLTNSSEGLYIITEPDSLSFLFHNKPPYLFIIIVMASIVIYVSKAIEKSKVGYYLAATRENEDAARCLGVNPLPVKTIAFAISAFLTASLGTFYAQFIQFIEPANVLSLNFSIQMPLIAIIGGVGEAYGPLIGSIIVTPLSIFLRAWLGGEYGAVHMVIYGSTLIVVVLTMQGGIHTAIRDRFSRRNGGQSATNKNAF